MYVVSYILVIMFSDPGMSYTLRPKPKTTAWKMWSQLCFDKVSGSWSSSFKNNDDTSPWPSDALGSAKILQDSTSWETSESETNDVLESMSYQNLGGEGEKENEEYSYNNEFHAAIGLDKDKATSRQSTMETS